MRTIIEDSNRRDFVCREAIRHGGNMDIELFERALARVMEDRKPGSLDETALRAVMDALSRLSQSQ